MHDLDVDEADSEFTQFRDLLQQLVRNEMDTT